MLATLRKWISNWSLPPTIQPKKNVSNVLPQEYITSLHTFDHVPSTLTMSVTSSSYHGHVIGDFPTMPSTIPIDLQELVMKFSCSHQLLVLLIQPESRASILNAVMSLLLNSYIEKIRSQEAEWQHALPLEMKELNCVNNLVLWYNNINHAKVLLQAMSNKSTPLVYQISQLEVCFFQICDWMVWCGRILHKMSVVKDSPAASGATTLF